MTHAETETLERADGSSCANRQAVTLERDPKLWWLLLARGRDLDLRVRARTGTGNWRFTCPVDSAHEVTLVNGVLPLPHRPQGLALTCHGPAGHDSPGHSLSTHQKHPAARVATGKFSGFLSIRSSLKIRPPASSAIKGGRRTSSAAQPRVIARIKRLNIRIFSCPVC